MKRRNILYILVFIGVLSGTSCQNKTIYSQVQALPLQGWAADSVLNYEVEITDTTATYDVLLFIRHTQQYAYQNMWLFVNNDTLEFYLADQRGQWLGNGWGRLREMPILYQHAKRFDHAGIYSYQIRQGMREACLQGINDVGLTVEKCYGKE